MGRKRQSAEEVINKLGPAPGVRTRVYESPIAVVHGGRADRSGAEVGPAGRTG